MTDYSNIPSQFDGISKDRPVVFISYSWDSDEHKQWVRHLSDALRSQYGVYTLLDQYNRSGFDLIQFMTKGLEVADMGIQYAVPIKTVEGSIRKVTLDNPKDVIEGNYVAQSPSFINLGFIIKSSCIMDLIPIIEDRIDSD